MFVQNTTRAVLEIKRERKFFVSAVNKTYGVRPRVEESGHVWLDAACIDLRSVVCDEWLVAGCWISRPERVYRRGNYTVPHICCDPTSCSIQVGADPPPCFSDACLCETTTFDSGGPWGRLCSEQTGQLPEYTLVDDASAPIVSYNMKARRSPLCWSSRCSRRTAGTPALLYPTSGSECSSPLFLQRCCRWWATCGPPRSSGFRRAEAQSEFLKVLSKCFQL